jgi:hypothetical protein
MNPPHGWPHRTSICLDCRTALPTGHSCPSGHARVQPLHQPAGREALLTEVWGPKEWRAELRKAAAAGAVGGSSLSWADCIGCDVLEGEAATILGVLLAVFVVFFLAWLLTRYVMAALRRRSARHSLRGAIAEPELGPSTGCVGVVVANAGALLAPLGGGACVAFAAELTHGRKRAVLLRDAATVGFTVQLDTGERVTVPAGPCVLDLSNSQQQSESYAVRYLGDLDPLRAGNDDLDPFAHDRVAAVTVRAGDRVELLSPLEARADAAEMRGYRDAAARVLVPQAPVRLRVVGRAEVAASQVSR